MKEPNASLDAPSRANSKENLAEFVVLDAAGTWPSMVATLRSYWTGAAGFQRLCYLSGLILMVSALVHAGVFLMDDLAWAGPVSWRKPVLFGFSFGITLITVGWMMGLMRLRKGTAWILSALLVGASLAEVALITMQVWRGVASHFNLATEFDSTVFDFMGRMVGVVGLVIVVVTIRSFGRLKAPSSMKWAIRIGLTILVLSQAMGGMIIANGLQAVNAAGDFQAEGLATASILGEAGAMKVPHAWTLHAAQVLPAMAWLLAFSSRVERQRLRIVLLAAAGYVSLMSVSLLQTFSERATFDMTALTVVLAVLGLALSAAGVVYTVLALARPNSGLESPTNRDV